LVLGTSVILALTARVVAWKSDRALMPVEVAA
jgi:hypothetical protein